MSSGKLRGDERLSVYNKGASESAYIWETDKDRKMEFSGISDNVE